MVFYGDSTASSLYIIGVKINDTRLFFFENHRFEHCQALKSYIIEHSSMSDWFKFSSHKSALIY